MTKTIPDWRRNAPAGRSLASLQAAVTKTPAKRDNSDFGGSIPPGWIVPAAQVRWLGPGVAFYTPQMVEQIFRQALAGDLQSQWEMFDLMESTWPRLSKNLNQLKDDVVANELKVVPWKAKDKDATPEALDRAAFIEAALWSMNPDPAKDENDFEDTQRDLLDARGKGISVLEVDYEMRELGDYGPSIVPRCTRWVHPAWYGYPAGPGNANLQLKSGPTTQYMSTVTAGPSVFQDFPDNKFIIGVCKNKTGHPLGAAMLHVLGFTWAAANFTAEYFLNFCAVFGQPIRWATYDPNMTPNDQAKLAAMLSAMGNNAWGMFPEGATFELKEAAKGGQDNIHKTLLEWADKQCDLLILRQTLTSDVSADGGSRAQGEVHERVLGGVELACAKWLCKTLNQLIRALCVLNYDDVDECPYLKPPGDEDEDPGELADVLYKLAQAGLEPTDAAIPELSERMTFEIQRKAAPEALPGTESLPGEDKLPNKPGAQLEAKAAPSLIHDPHISDVIAGKRKEALTAAYKGVMAPFRQIILASSSRGDCLQKLAAHYSDWAPTRLNTELETALQIAAAAGAAEAKP